MEASLGMAKKLNISAVAEGVETQADWDCCSSWAAASCRLFMQAHGG